MPGSSNSDQETEAQRGGRTYKVTQQSCGGDSRLPTLKGKLGRGWSWARGAMRGLRVSKSPQILNAVLT